MRESQFTTAADTAVFSNLLSQGVRHYVLVEQADEIIEPANVALMTGVTMDDVGRHKLDIADRMAQSLPGVHLARSRKTCDLPGFSSD